MLKLLSLTNFLTVESLTLSLETGFTAFTGETGAGKSVLMEAIALAFGKKGGSDLVRYPAQEAQITVLFELPPDHPLFIFLTNQGFLLSKEEEGSLLIKRIISTEGKSRCFINDAPATLGTLKECAKSLIEIHGQFDRLLEKEEHRLFLDNYANLSALVENVQNAFHKWKEHITESEKIDEELICLARENAFFLDHFEELLAFAPQENEEDFLLQKRLTFINQKKLNTLIGDLDTVFDGNTSLSTSIAFLEKGFSRLSGLTDEFLRPQQDLDALASVWIDLCASYKEARSSLLDCGADSLENVEERLHLLRTLARKHQTQPNSLYALLDAFEEKKKRIEQLEALKKALHMEGRTHEAFYVTQATLLSKERSVAKKKLEERIISHLKKLQLERLIFKVNILPLNQENWTSRGIDSIAFLVSANGETLLGSFKDKLSGGELSRVLLALKVELAQNTSLRTIIFDEIDSAMSGAVATHIGNTLDLLSTQLQVLVITHTPHVASCAQHHIKISKTFEDNRPLTQARYLSTEERVLEMARMLSGTEITLQATEQAQHFLESNPLSKYKDSSNL